MDVGINVTGCTGFVGETVFSNTGITFGAVGRMATGEGAASGAGGGVVGDAGADFSGDTIIVDGLSGSATLALDLLSTGEVDFPSRYPRGVLDVLLLPTFPLCSFSKRSSHDADLISFISCSSWLYLTSSSRICRNMIARYRS